MTDVGKISLGVEIDASDLSAKLGAAVRKAIAPALAQVQRELNKVQREYDKTARSAEKSATAQTTAARAAARAVNELGDEQTKAAAKTAAAATVSTAAARRDKSAKDALKTSTREVANAQAEVNTAIDIFGRRSPQAAAAAKRLERAQAAHTQELLRAATASRVSTGAQIRDYERLARAAEESAARQAAAARIAAAAGSGGGGGGGGSPGRRRGGVLGFMTSPVGLNLGALGLGSLPAATTAVVNLAGALQQVGQAGLALPGVFSAAVSSIGVAVAGFSGMSDAVKALNEAAKSGDPKDLEKAAEALKDMDPAAQAVAKTFSGLVRGPLLDLRKQIQGRMFVGFDKDLQSLADTAIPRLSGGIGGIADAWNGTLKTLTGSLGNERNMSLLDRVFGNTAEGQKRMNAAIDPLIHGMGTLAAAGTDVLPRLADGLTKVAKRFDAWITGVDGDGRLRKWIDDGLTAVRQLGESFLNVGKMITGLSSAADGQGFLNWLERSTSSLQRLINSANGQNSLHNFFTEGERQLRQWGELLKSLGPVLLAVLEAAHTWSGVLLPVLQGITDLLAMMPGSIHAVLVAFLAWRSIKGITSVIDGLTGIGTALDRLPGKAAGAGRGVSRALSALGSTKGMLGLGLLAGGTAQQIGATSTGESIMGALSTVGGGALTGAAIGSVVPGIGTALGAGVGAGVGTALAGVNFLLGQNKAASDAAAQAQDELAAAMGRSQAATELMGQAQKTLADSLLASGGIMDPAAIAAIGDQISQIPDKLAGTMDADQIKGVADAIKGLGLTTQQMATIVSGGQPQFDALVANLVHMGPAGLTAAQQLQAVRDAAMNVQTTATTAAPLLQQLATAMATDVPQAFANLQNAFSAVPKDVAIDITMPGGQAVYDILKDIGAQISTNENGVINLSAPLSDEVLGQLQALGVQIEQNRDGTINVHVDQAALATAKGEMDSFMSQYTKMLISPVVEGPGIVNTPKTLPGLLLPGGGKANGGVLPGWSPGRDNMLVPMSGGEGVLIPEAVRGIGGAAAIYAINSRFRPGLSRKGYAGGGVVGFDDGGVVPGTPETELGVLKQIRDLLAGKGGPLAATATNTAATAKAFGPGGSFGGGGSGGVGMFGTPLKTKGSGNAAYDMLAGALRGLGEDPETILGAAPNTVGFGGGMTGGPAAMNYSAITAALSAFARSGNLSDVTGVGLDANDPVISALTTARNKKRGRLSDDAITSLIDQTFGPGGYTGTLDSSNSALAKSLQRFKEQLAKQSGAALTTAVSGMPTAGLAGTPQMPGSAAALIQFAQQANGGKYAAASDLASGLADCSGAVSDLVELVTKGQATPDRLFSTANEAEVLKRLGAVPGLIPGTLQIGVSPTHTAATLPNGVNFESGGSGGGVVYGGPVGAGDKQFTQTFSLPVSGALPTAGMPGGLPGGGTAGGSGTPVYVTNWPGGGGGLGAAMGRNMLGAGLSAAGQAAGNVGGDILNALPAGVLGSGGGAHPTASLSTLVNEGNPMAFLAASGFNIADFTREGGAGSAAIAANQGPGYDATGRLFSDTTAMIDRTFTSLNAQLQATREQIVDATKQVSNKLTDEALEPVFKAGLQSGLEGLKSSVSTALGSAMGTAAAPPIASAVASAIPKGDGGGTGEAASTATSAISNVVNGALGKANGGPIYGGIPGKDSVPILAQQGEYVFDRDTVNKMGGVAGAGAIHRAIKSGRMPGFATGGGVNVNDTVGAEFFGVSQVPIIGAIVNTLIRVLLKVLGVEIEARDTMQEMTGDFRQFRGDAFRAFDAQGRLLNDTSGLIERSATSEQTAADERIRILKIVIQALIKYIIEKVIVPIAKAVGKAAVNALAAAAQGAASAAPAPGASVGGAIAGSLISSAGDAAIEIAAQIGQDFALAISQTLIDVISNGLQSAFPDIMTGLFSGSGASLISDPIGNVLSTMLGGFMGGLTALFGGLFGGASTMIPGMSFDNGGMAEGIGYLPKATMDDELVLSPGETDLFSRFVAALERGGFGNGGGNRTVHAPITVLSGGRETAEQVEDRLLKLMS